MKVTLLLAIFMFFLLSACTTAHFVFPAEASNEPGGVDGSDSGSTDPALSLRGAFVIDTSGDSIGYSAGWYKGAVLLYDPTEDRYAEINPTTGEYLNHPVSTSEAIYFASAGCTGSGVVPYWYGQAGNSIIKVVGNYYEVNSATEYTAASSFIAASRYTISNGCITSGYSAVGYLGNISSASSVADYTSGIPYTLEYE